MKAKFQRVVRSFSFHPVLPHCSDGSLMFIIHAWYIKPTADLSPVLFSFFFALSILIFFPLSHFPKWSLPHVSSNISLRSSALIQTICDWRNSFTRWGIATALSSYFAHIQAWKADFCWFLLILFVSMNIPLCENIVLLMKVLLDFSWVFVFYSCEDFEF